VERAAPEKGSVHAVVQDTLVRHGWTLTESEVSTTRLMQTSVVHNFSDIDVQSRSDSHRAGANVDEGRSWEVYGDGATYESMDRAGWGLYMRT
jgi:hypothetical protein